MNLLKNAFHEATPRTVRRLGLLSLVLVLALTAHGFRFLHTLVKSQWERDASVVVGALVVESDLLFDVAVAALERQEAEVRELPTAASPSQLEWSALRSLGSAARLVRVEPKKPANPDAATLATLKPAPLYRQSSESSDLQLGFMNTAPARRSFFIWKDLPDTPNGVSRIGVLLCDDAVLRIARHLHTQTPDQKLPIAAQLLPAAGPEPLEADEAFDVVHRKPLSRVNLTAEVRVSHGLVLETWTVHTAPLFVAILIGTGLLVTALLLLTRATARQERETNELREVRALARAAHRSQGALHAAVSHELSLPLAGIIGVGKLLQADTRRADAHRLVSVLLLSARNLHSLVRDILVRTAQDSAQSVCDPVPTNPLAVGTEVVDLFYASAVAKGIDLTFVSVAVARQVQLDAFALRQVLANLVGNAVKHTQHGGVTVTCTLTETSDDPNKTRLRYEVKDTGRGISSDELKTLYTPSVPEKSGDAPARIGLTLTRRLVQQMGGDLEVTSTVGQGTRFSFELEVPAVATPAAIPSAAMQSVGLAPLKESDARILVVEDNPVSAMVTETQLRSLGYSCDVSPDGEAALAAMAVGGYDLVLMDCTLPGLSGHDVTKHWRAFEKRSGAAPLPIVALTAKSMGMHMQQCLDVGMSDFLAKPCSADTLGLTIERWLREVRGRSSST